MYKLSWASKARPIGKFSWAEVAGPSSPHEFCRIRTRVLWRSGKGGNDAGFGINAPDGGQSPLGDEKIALRIHRNTAGIGETGGGGEAAIAAGGPSGALLSVACDGGDDRRNAGVDFADDERGVVQNIKIPGSVGRDGELRLDKGGLGGGTAVPVGGADGPAAEAGAGVGGDRVGFGVDAAQALAGGFQRVNVSGFIDGQRFEECRGRLWWRPRHRRPGRRRRNRKWSDWRRRRRRECAGSGCRRSEYCRRYRATGPREN